MASSTYRMWAVLETRNTSTEIPYNFDFHKFKTQNMERGGKFYNYSNFGMSNLAEYLKNNDEETILIKVGDAITCRESVLNLSFIFTRVMERNGTHRIFKFYVEFYAESGVSGENWKKRKDKATEFFNTFEGVGDLLRLTRPEGDLFVEFCSHYPQTPDVEYKLSFFLYMFRNPELMDKFLEVWSGNKSGWLPKFRWLSEQFLLNPTWGNMSNSNLSLSIYAYMQAAGLSMGHISGYKANGPVAAANFCTFAQMYQYIQNILMPRYKSPSEFKDACRDGTLNLTYFPNSDLSLIQDLFSTLYSKNRANESKEKRVAKKADKAEKSLQEIVEESVVAQNMLYGNSPLNPSWTNSSRIVSADSEE